MVRARKSIDDRRPDPMPDLGDSCARECRRVSPEMDYLPDAMNNIYDRAHGGAIYSLIDEAFETACQTHGTVAVALNVNASYTAAPEPGIRLMAEAKEITRSKKIAHYDISVTDDAGRLIATAKTIAFRTGKPIPFYDPKS